MMLYMFNGMKWDY